jgi:hypothetical protein
LGIRPQPIPQRGETLRHDDEERIAGDPQRLQLALVGGSALKPLDELGRLNERQFSDTQARRIVVAGCLAVPPTVHATVAVAVVSSVPTDFPVPILRQSRSGKGHRQHPSGQPVGRHCDAPDTRQTSAKSRHEPG